MQGKDFAAGDLYINEFLASNTITNMSSFEEYADWIEIKNSSAANINISGYSLTDDLSKPAKYKIPANTIIPARGYFLFWADDRDSSNHLNFKLDKKGESLGLYNPDGIALDTLTFGSQSDDISYGRLPGNNNYWSFFSMPTPGEENIVSSIDISPIPVFSVPGGFYSESQIISITTSEPSEIRYTIDGAEPSLNSLLYNSPLQIDSTTALRVRTFTQNKLPGEIITLTYFINVHHALPVFSLVTDPANFFSDTSGIYVTGTRGIRGDCDPTVRNLNQDWERPVHLEMFETDGELVLNQDAGVKIFGGCSRTRYPQKSLSLFARGEYGKGSFKHKLFKDKDIKEFETFILRSAADDQVFTMFRDGLAATLVAQDPDADYMAFRPSVVYLNGVYWGIHNIREKINEHYIVGNFGLKENEFNLIEKNPLESWNIKWGSADSYTSMMDYIGSNPMSNEVHYKYVSSLMDIEHFINYEIGHMYLGEIDWPGNNIRYWKANSGKYSKWRWINYDMDQTVLHVDTNIVFIGTQQSGNPQYWPNPKWSTRLIGNLLLNSSFRNLFIQRFAFLINTIYSPQSIIRIVDSLQNLIAAEIPAHIQKWGGQFDPDFHENWDILPTFSSVEEWQANVDVMRTFANERPQIVLQQIIDKFGISGTSVVTAQCNDSSAGKILITGKPVPKGVFTGTFFRQVPFKIEAVPGFGFKFSHWDIAGTLNFNRNVDVTLTSDLNITAYFEPEDISDTSLVIINEINYNPANDYDTGDWIELYNRRSSEMNISGWYIQNEDDDKKFVFSEGTKISSHGYLVVNGNSYDFHTTNPVPSNYVGDFRFSLSGKGEVIKLYSDNGSFVDSVHYDNNAPWPESADGKGSTLELKNSSLDNDDPANWIASAGHGTPGSANGVTAVEETKENIPYTFALYANYPNPFNPVTKIKYSVGESASGQKTTIKVFNILGREIITLVDEHKEPGLYEVEFNASGLSSGVYFYRMDSGSFIKTMKLVFLK